MKFSSVAPKKTRNGHFSIFLRILSKNNQKKKKKEKLDRSLDRTLGNTENLRAEIATCEGLYYFAKWNETKRNETTQAR